jgi:hypothetical protein
MRLWIGGIYYGLRSSANKPPSSLEGLRFHGYLKQSYRNAVRNGIRILAVFTGDTTRQTYDEQMLDAFPDIAFGDQLRLEFLKSTDHLFTSQNDRARLFEIILNWVASIEFQSDSGIPLAFATKAALKSSAQRI